MKHPAQPGTRTARTRRLTVPGLLGDRQQVDHTRSAEELLATLRQLTTLVEQQVTGTALATAVPRAEEEILRRSRELSVLNSIASTLASTLDLDEMLGGVLDRLLELLGVDVGMIFLADREAGEVRLNVHRGASEALARDAARIKFGTGLAGRVALTGQPTIIDNVAEDPRTVVVAAVQENLRAYACIPIHFHGVVLGALSLLSHHYRFFRPDELELLLAIGQQIGGAIENARLHDQLMQLQQERIASLRERLRAVTQAQADERRRLARAIQVEVGVQLEALSGDLALEARAAPRSASHAATARDLHRSLQRLLRELTESGSEIRLADILQSDLLPRLSRPGGGRITVEHAGWPSDLPSEIEELLTAIVREQLAEIGSYRKLRELRVRLQGDESSLRLSIRSRAEGLSNASRLIPRKSIQETALLLGGEVRLEIDPSGDALFDLRLPRHPALTRSRTIRVLLACANPSLAESIRRDLGTDAGIELVGVVSTTDRGAQLSSELNPDIVLVHVESVGHGSGVIGWGEDFSPARVVLVTRLARDPRVAEALRAGAKGCVLEDCAAEELVRSIKTVHAGGFLLSAAVASALFLQGARASGVVPGPGVGPLTEREREILRLLSPGRSTRQIALLLKISDKTVRNHLSRIYEKLQLEDRAQAVLYAHQHGLTQLH